jgi:hypothetical protein
MLNCWSSCFRKNYQGTNVIEFFYELPGGAEILVQADVTPETIVIHRCLAPSGDIDPDRIWIDMDDDVGLWPLTQLLKQEATERAHGN